VIEAARQAISCPLIDQTGIRGARNILLNVTGSARLGLHEVNDACQMIRQAAGRNDVQVNFGLTFNEDMADSVKVTLIASGFPERGQMMETVEEQSASQSGWLSESQPEAPAPVPVPVAVPEPVAVAVETKPPNGTPALPPVEELDDLDKPAYLRQRRVLH